MGRLCPSRRYIQKKKAQIEDKVTVVGAFR